MKFWKRFKGGRAQPGHTAAPSDAARHRLQGPDFYSMQQRLEKVAEIRKRGSLCLRWDIAGTFVPARLAAFTKACLVEDNCSGSFSDDLVKNFEAFCHADAAPLEEHRLFMNS